LRLGEPGSAATSTGWELKSGLAEIARGCLALGLIAARVLE
jgi:hypothetical protein